MIICSGCGHANGTTDAFCGSCGGFLEWDGEEHQPSRPVTPVAASVPDQRAEPEDRLSVRVDALLRQLVVEPPARDRGRAPDVEHERVAPVRPDPLDLGPADLYCGACGSGNAEGRSFCRRCGAPLDDAERVARLPWWRRCWLWLRGRLSRRRTFLAGERPEAWGKHSDPATSGGRSKRRWWKPRLPTRISLGKLALPLALLSMVGFGIAPVRAAITHKVFALWSQGRTVVAPRFVPVTASGATATSAQGGHDASAAIDQNLLTWWAEGHPGRGRGQRLTVRFDRPVDLARVTVHDGAAEAAFPFQPRVRDLRVTLRGPHGVIDERRVLLADKAALQEVPVDGHGVTRVTLRILSTYAGQKGSAASLAEVAFYTKA